MSHDSELALESASLVATLRLALVPGVGPRTRCKLLERFGMLEEVLRAAPEELRNVQGVRSKLCRAIATARDKIDAEAEIELCRTSGIDILTQADEVYPTPLNHLPDPPGVLFV